MLAETLKTYLEVLEIYTDEQVGEACARLTREAREFPPTAGEVRGMCEKIVVASQPVRPDLTDQSHSANGLTLEERAANVAKFKALIEEIGWSKEQEAPRPAPRAAPFNLGNPLLQSLVNMGLAKPVPRAALEDDDAPTF